MHINSIGAGMYSDLSVADGTVPTDTQLALPATAEAAFKALFPANGAGTGENEDYFRVKDVREFPAMGTPPNIVNVPVFGQASSQQIQGQSDAPSIELQINYVAADWASGSDLGDMVGDGVSRVFRFTLLNSKPDSYGNVTGEIATVQNSQYYWIGKIEAIQVTPNLTDANTATISITIQSDFYGAYTVNP